MAVAQRGVDRGVTIVLRLCVAAGTAYVLWHEEHFDALLRGVWRNHLRTHWFVRHDTCEPLVATMGFAIPMLGWYGLDKALERHPRALSWVRRYQINPAGRSTASHAEHNCVRSLGAYLLPIATFDALFPRRTLPLDCPSLPRIVVGVLAALWLFDLLTFAVHWGLHHSARARGVHKRHHAPRPLVSTDTLRHGLVDGALQVGCSIASLNVLGLHPLTRLVYNVVVCYMLTEAHCGYDLPFMLHRLVPFGVVGGSVRHEAHHKYGDRNFEQLFVYLDGLAGTGRK